MANIGIQLLQNQVTQLRRDLWGDEFAHCISRITIEWGGVEFLLFCVLQAIDYKKADDWAAIVFAPRSLKTRKEIVLKHVTNSVRASYPKFIDLLVQELGRLQSIQDRRNLLAHGLWLKGADDRTFKIQPLNINKLTNAVEGEIEVDLAYLANLIEDIQRLGQALSALTAEMLAHQQLGKWGRR